MRARQGGFTLLELLIGMVLLGLLLGLLFGALRLGASSWDSGDKRVDQTAQLRGTQSFLRRQLSQIYPLRWKTDQHLAFAGTADGMRFVASLPAQVSEGGLYLLGLELENGEEGRRLILRRAANPGAKDFSSLEQGDKSPLVDHVEKMSISYFGAVSPDKSAAWQDKWDDIQRLPALIRIQLKLADGRDWPDLVVPLAVEKGCAIWDAFHQRCVN